MIQATLWVLTSTYIKLRCATYGYFTWTTLDIGVKSYLRKHRVQKLLYTILISAINSDKDILYC